MVPQISGVAAEMNSPCHLLCCSPHYHWTLQKKNKCKQ